MAEPSLLPPLGEITPNNHGAIVSLFTFIFLSCTGIVVLAKIASMIYLKRSVPSVDIPIWICMVIALVQSILTQVAVNHGMGRHRNEVSSDSFDAYNKVNYAAEFLLLLVLALSKVSTGNLIRSISPSKSILRWCLMVQIGLGVWTLLAVFGTAFQCPAPYWEYSPTRCVGKQSVRRSETMASLDEVFKNATENGSILGAVLLGRDTSGKFNYSKAFGRRTFGDGEESLMRTDAVLSFASATKIITCIAVMQLVEAGKLNLEDDMSPIIPELAAQEVLVGFDEGTGEPQLRKRKNPLKLRYLLTHSAGLAYNFLNPSLQRWAAFNNHTPQTSSTVVGRFTYPLTYEPGTGWDYSPGIDWAGKVVERVTGETLESYFQKHIFAPLDISSLTFWPHKHPSIQRNLATMTTRASSGGVEAYEGPYLTDGAEDCFGGHGAYGNMEDYMKILTSLLVNDGTLLRKETADLFFTPQLTVESKAAQKALIDDPEKIKIFVGDFPSDVKYDWGLGGILIQSDGSRRRSKGTMIWSGMPNLFWFIDRAKGLCGVIGMQLLPPADPTTQELVKLFEEGMYELLGNKNS
ncbi:hypothetical protein CNMCM7691_001174 [Aspergillus felis]|uniref:Beta-lactamase-related domain-containing protein n=1 Tax=Aspergillus felis TaxID=1287682 RepID=A0A8H6R0Z9_9EURO|nr:hypothetical protein CNMCM7691_001174 [Aspergillus felis]